MRTRILPVLVIGLALAFVPAAYADGSSLSLNFSGRAPAHYTFSGSGFPGKFSSASFTFVKSFKKGTISESHTWFLAHAHVKVSKSLRSGSLKGKSSNVSVNMTFHPTGPAKRVRVPKGCTGKPGSEQPGFLSGSLRLKTGHKPFNTYRARRLSAFEERFADVKKCKSTGPGTKIVGQQVNGSFGKVNLSGFIFKSGSRTFRQLTFSVFTGSGSNSVSHSISDFRTPSSALSISGTTAHVGGLSPLTSGSMDLNGCTDQWSGSYIAKFDFVGTQHLNTSTAFGSITPPLSGCGSPGGGGATSVPVG